ncbi:MAG TPA: ATP-binding cassette domain-containing protein [Devosiaceae bacterium]|jgi:ABC-type glutathione transport system ATPase component
MTSGMLLDVEQVNFSYHRAGMRTHAVRDVSLHVGVGEVLGIVGESGCGKSSLARLLVGLAQPTTGRIALDGTELAGHRSRAQRRAVQMVFQDPRSALNPRMSVFQLLDEGWRTHPDIAPVDRRKAAAELVDKVGLDPILLGRTPSQLSGGQAQRVSIARALAISPRLLICDEAVSALDVSVQTQVLKLLADIRRDMNLSMIFISHDLGVVRQISDRVAVMYLGEIVETGPTQEVFENPRHDYTRQLVSAALDLSTEFPSSAAN